MLTIHGGTCDMDIVLSYNVSCCNGPAREAARLPLFKCDCFDAGACDCVDMFQAAWDLVF